MIWHILITIIVLLILGVLAMIAFKKKGKQEPDYRIFFILGVTWVPLGIVLKNYAFLGMGVVFMAIGLMNKSKWRKPEPVSKNARRVLFVLVGITSLLVLATAFIVFTITKN